MAKIKYLSAKGTYTFDGLSSSKLELIHALVQHVILGSDDRFREAAYELIGDFDESPAFDETVNNCVVEFEKDSDGATAINVTDVT